MTLIGMLVGSRVRLDMLPVAGDAWPVFSRRWTGGPREGAGTGVIPGRPGTSVAIVVLPEKRLWKNYRKLDNFLIRVQFLCTF